jgi:hypothetical protein
VVGAAVKLLMVGGWAATYTPVEELTEPPPRPVTVSTKTYSTSSPLVVAGTVTVLVRLPPEQGTEAGRPFIDGLTEMTQMVAWVTLPVRVTGPPVSGSLLVLAVNEVIRAGVGSSGTPRVSDSVAPLEAIAFRVTKYVMTFEVVFAGIETVMPGWPFGHTIVVGRPLIAGDDENSQFTVSVVSASRRTEPPFAVSCFGVAL